jgi:hypothetical protein
MWFVTPADRSLTAQEFKERVASFSDDLTAEQVAGTPQDWREITVKDSRDWWWFNVERYPAVRGGERWDGDLEFFRSWLAIGKPEVNARWMEEYLNCVRTVYQFTCSISCPETNIDCVNHLVRALRNDGLRGMLYAELEGWMNEFGAHITWEFRGNVSGDCLMAIRQPAGWVYFPIELSSPEQSEAFKSGLVPVGIDAEEHRD